MIKLELFLTIIVECILVIVLPLIATDMIRKRGRFYCQWSLKRWWLIFLTATMVDIASTYFVVLVRDVPWTAEQNIVVMIFGSSMGHGNVLILENILFLLVSYGIADIVRGPKSRAFFMWFFV